MELINEFSVGVPVGQAWQALTDLERVAPCLPGATLTAIDGDDHHGTVKIKVGPVTASYAGTARFASRDDEGHHAVIDAAGRDTRGQGNARARIDLRLHPQGDGTRVVITTDLEIAGRIAQFGRGVIADVSGKLIGQFAASLEQNVLTPSSVDQPTASTRTDIAPTVAPGRRVDDAGADAEPVDLLALAGGRPQLRAAGMAGAGALLLALAVLLHRGRARAAVTPAAGAGTSVQRPLVLVVGVLAEPAGSTTGKRR